MTPDAFDRFWAVYPRKVGKQTARRTFARAIEHGVDAEALITGAQRYAVERSRQNPKYTKHPRTWLLRSWETSLTRPVVSEWRQKIAKVTKPIEWWRKLSRISAVSPEHHTRISAAIEAMDMACASGSDHDIAAAGKAEVEAWEAFAAFARTIPVSDEPDDPWADFERDRG